MSDKFLPSYKKWPSTSRWSARELLLLHVDNRKCPGQMLLEPEWADYHDDELAKLLSKFPCDVVEYSEMLRPEIDNGIKGVKDFEEKFHTYFGHFYKEMAELLRSSNNMMESQAALNTPLEDVVAFVVQQGSAVPLCSDSGSSCDPTSGVVDSPPVSRSVRFVSLQMSKGPQAEEPIETVQGTFPPQLKMPKSSSMKSVVSNLSDEMGTTEDQTKFALFALLEGIVQSMDERLDVLRRHSRFVIKIGGVEGPVSINDGQITLAPQLNKSNRVPLINVECKSRSGSSGVEVLSKLYSQEYGECLAIVQKRLEASKYVISRSVSIMDVYSIGAHGGRAYLVRASFNGDYLDGLDAGELDDSRVVVTRSDRTYRLDKVDELKEFVTLIYRLCKQLESEIAAGRRY